MIVYHVCSISKLDHYRQLGKIKAPVRAWVDINEAVRFSCQTGRPIILRLRFPDTAKVLEGHKGLARVLDTDYNISNILGKLS